MIDYPSYSLKERDRRFNIAHELIVANGLDGIVVFGANSRQGVESYFTNELAGGVVIIPKSGEPRLQTLYAGRVAARRESRRADVDVWVPDAVLGNTPPALAKALAAKGLAKAKLGTINGPEAQSFTAWNGYQATSPDVEWVDITKQFNLATLIKSDEELDAFRWCAFIGEKATEALIAVAKPGALDSDLVGAFIGEVYRYRGTMLIPTLELGIGPETVHFSSPVWWASGGKPYALQPGDIIQAEGMISYGGLETQPQVTVALKPVPEVYEELAPLAHKVYRLAVENLQAGRTFGEVLAAVEGPLEAHTGWVAGNAIHILNPNVAHGQFQINIDRSEWLGPVYASGPVPQVTDEMRAMVIKPGMTFTVEPSPGRGNNRIHIGGNLIVRPSGPAEELNTVGTTLVIQ